MAAPPFCYLGLLIKYVIRGYVKQADKLCTNKNEV